jgi:hypothetical protein
VESLFSCTNSHLDTISSSLNFVPFFTFFSTNMFLSIEMALYNPCHKHCLYFYPPNVITTSIKLVYSIFICHTLPLLVLYLTRPCNYTSHDLCTICTPLMSKKGPRVLQQMIYYGEQVLFISSNHKPYKLLYSNITPMTKSVEL